MQPHPSIMQLGTRKGAGAMGSSADSGFTPLQILVCRAKRREPLVDWAQHNFFKAELARLSDGGTPSLPI